MPSDDEIHEICCNPLLLREAAVLAPLLAQATRGCGEEQVRLALQPLILVYGVGEAARSPAFWRVYFKQLADLPAEALARGVDAYAGEADSHFFPKPGPLKALAERFAVPIRKAAYRTKRAVEIGPRRHPVERTPEEIEAVRSMARGFRIVPKDPAA